MTNPSRTTHVDDATIRRFALGQLPEATMARVERHFGGCAICALVAESVPGDRLMGLLRRESPAGVEGIPVAS